MFSLILLFGIGSSVFQLNSGLTLTSPNTFIPTTGFTLICKVEGSINTTILVSDPMGNRVASCLQPPSGCSSAPGNTFDRNIPDGIFSVNISQTYVQKGIWTCTDGRGVAQFDVEEVLSITKPMVWIEAATPSTGTEVMILVECIFPYPDEIRINYVKESAPTSVLENENGLKTDNGTSANCPVSDVRAISINGTFTLSLDNPKENAIVAATVIFNGIVVAIGYSNFTVLSNNENQASNAGKIAGGVVGGIVLVGCFVGAGFYFKKRKGKGGLSQNDDGNLENNTGSKTTKDEEGKQSPPTSASKIQLADKLKS